MTEFVDVVLHITRVETPQRYPLVTLSIGSCQFLAILATSSKSAGVIIPAGIRVMTA